MRFVRDLRLIPVVALAAAALFVLKVSAIVIEGGYTLIASRAALAQGLGEGANAKDFELPPPAALEDAAPAPRGDPRALLGARHLRPARIHRLGRGSRSPMPPAPRPRRRAAPKVPPPRRRAEMPKPALSAGERAVLESLQQRRQELETRAREIDVRDSLLKAAEKRIEQRAAGTEGAGGAPHRRGHQEGRGGGREVQEPRHACTRT